MKTYTIDEFTIGEIVYHKSNLSISMVVEEIKKEENKILCNLYDRKNSEYINKSFSPSVLCKGSDKPTIRRTSIKT